MPDTRYSRAKRVAFGASSEVQTDVNLASTRDPATADTSSGERDMVMRVIHTAGTYTVTLMVGYHSH